MGDLIQTNYALDTFYFLVMGVLVMFMAPGFSVFIGAVGGVLVVFSIILLDKLKIDDPVGAISVHGTAGIWGLLAVCITNGEATIGAQLLGIGAIFIWVFLTSLVVWYGLKKLMGIRISEEDEYEGADLSETGIEAYPEFAKG